MKYRVGDLFKWVNDECNIPDAMGDVYVLVKDYTLKEGEEDTYLKKEENTYSLLTVYSSEGNYVPFSSELPYEVIEDRIDECLYRVGNVADINSCETVEFDDDYDDDDDFEDDLGELYETTCPACSNTIRFDYEQAATGAMDCPNCGQHLEFELDDDDAE